MQRSIAFLLIIGALILCLWSFVPVNVFFTARSQRLNRPYHKDLQKFSQTKNGKKLLSHLQNYEFDFADPQVSEELPDLSFPWPTKEGSKIFLSIEVIRWIEGKEYGYTLQHSFYDITSGEQEKIYEWSRIYKVGLFL